MEEYIKWLENGIKICSEDKDLQREHWVFCQALRKYRELTLHQPPAISSVYHQGINDSIKTIESILDYKSNTQWGSALRCAVNQIKSCYDPNVEVEEVEELAEMLNKSSEMETAIKEVLELFDANGVPNIEWIKNRLSEAVK